MGVCINWNKARPQYRKLRTLLFARIAWVLANQYREDAGVGPSGLSSLSKKTIVSNRLQMSEQRQHFLFNYHKTTSVGQVLGSHSRPTTRQSGAP